MSSPATQPPAPAARAAATPAAAAPAAASPPLARATAVRRGRPPAPVTARRKRRSAEVSEQLLLDAAQQVFSDKGYIRSTVQDIIAGTGLSRGAFYRYFDSTDGIFLAVVSRVADELIAESRGHAGRTLRERVHAGNLRYLQVFARHRGVMRALFEAAYVNPRIAEVQARMRSAYLRRVRAHLVRQHALGHCLPIDVDAATLTLGMMVEGAAQAWVVMGLEPFEQPLDLQRLCSQVTETWCRAVYRDPDQLLPERAAAPADDTAATSLGAPTAAPTPPKPPAKTPKAPKE